jgi:hypothetical protein
MFVQALYWGRPVALGIGSRPLSTDLVVSCLDNLDVECAILPPAILEEMSQREDCIRVLRNCSFIMFGGGKLAPDAGNHLVKNGITLWNFIGATEFAPFPIYCQKDRDLWQYFIYDSENFGCYWRRIADAEDAFEQVIVPKDKAPGIQGMFYTFPNMTEYATEDIYRPHPTKPNNWIYHGRSDNIIVFSNGEKLNPTTIDEYINNNPEVKGAMVVGKNRFQAGLILEPAQHYESKEDEQMFLDRVWQYVVKANEETVTHGRIGHGMIMVTKLDKPLPRAPKGTIQRQGAISLYAKEIDQLYQGAEQQSLQTDAPHIDISLEETMLQCIQVLFKKHLGAPYLKPDQELFAAGIDSLQTINASKMLRAGLAAIGCHPDASSMSARVIYAYPTPLKLSKHILESVAGGQQSNAHDEEEVLQAMKHMWYKYTQNLLTSIPGRPEPSNENQTVIITGTTGMLDSYMLDEMVKSPMVKRVVCLPRVEDGGIKQQEKAMRTRGLTLNYLDKAEFHHADMSRTNFGLPRNLFLQLLEDADRFIHNAWPVNFNIPFQTFEPHVKGVRSLTDFVTQSKKRMAVIFISPVGTSDRWDASKGPVPEARLEDLKLPSGAYGRSKLVSSLILEDAARVGDFPAACIRVGQVAGPESKEGCWNHQE